MMLKIRNVGPIDFGSYKCVAKNSLGETDGVIKLEGKKITYQRYRSPKLNKLCYTLYYTITIISEIPAPTTARTTPSPPTIPPMKRGKNLYKHIF